MARGIHEAKKGNVMARRRYADKKERYDFIYVWNVVAEDLMARRSVRR
jgi:hypothetical protein